MIKVLTCALVNLMNVFAFFGIIKDDYDLIDYDLINLDFFKNVLNRKYCSEVHWGVRTSENIK